jgi:hypothetical protein
MPRGDQTGPMGMGKMSGRKAGYCAGFKMPGYSNPSHWQDFKNNFRGHTAWSGGIGGGQRRQGNRYAANLPWWMRLSGCAMPRRYQRPDPELERQALEQRAQILREELEFIEKQLAMIKNEAKEPQA